ncbi:hypothetical protein KSF_046720 [Reticulibacter mediterranei]|uniref:Uncharacterized protein n=1 Tax=Reticulibacter mediterranei TaxID=2778369 RepID=A0A8J3IN64_9CHLR|nr:hypothetical protein [Reticulibacter mediterranei]GHO94624.1 hypothetical protein KSF_046720 [Reticulibacter mediterranei]
MLNAGYINEHDREDERFAGGQMTVLQQLRCLQNDIEGQGSRVAKALDPITKALHSSGNPSLEMMEHIKAQILLAHLQLDELEQLLNSIDERSPEIGNTTKTEERVI